MEGLAIVALLAAFLPFVVSLGGRGGVWKFLAFVFCVFAIFGAASVIGIGGGILAWIVAWIFAAIAVSARRNDERFARLEKKMLDAQAARLDASPVDRLLSASATR